MRCQFRKKEREGASQQKRLNTQGTSQVHRVFTWASNHCSFIFAETLSLFDHDNISNMSRGSAKLCHLQPCCPPWQAAPHLGLLVHYCISFVLSPSTWSTCPSLLSLSLSLSLARSRTLSLSVSVLFLSLFLPMYPQIFAPQFFSITST